MHNSHQVQAQQTHCLIPKPSHSAPRITYLLVGRNHSRCWLLVGNLSLDLCVAELLLWIQPQFMTDERPKEEQMHRLILPHRLVL